MFGDNPESGCQLLRIFQARRIFNARIQINAVR